MPEREREAGGSLGREAMAFVPDSVRMLRGVLTDSRVPQEAKVEAAAAAAYLASPLHKAVAKVPGLRTFDRPAVVALAVRRLLVDAGEPVLREHWKGSEGGLQVVLALSRLLSTGGASMRRAVLASAVLTALNSRAARTGRVVEGEVVSRYRAG